MGSSYTNIHFDYEGYYSKSGDDYEWIPKEGRLYAISFKTSSMDEITYAALEDKINRKVSVDACTTRLSLSYIPLVVKPQRQSYILDDEDVFVYLTSLDKDQRRSILHVEAIRELEIVPINEQQSRVENASSIGKNYSEFLSTGRDELGGSHGVDTLHNTLEEAGKHLEVTESVEKNANEDPEDVVIGLDKMDNVENIVDDTAICEYVELPLVSEESRRLIEWEDGMGIEIGQEFASKESVIDLIDRASQQNCFGVTLLNSDKSRYVVRCRGAAEGCKWYVRAAKVQNSDMFSIRTYIKMHTCSRTTSSTGTKRKGTPRLVASILHDDYPGEFETPTPKTLVGLVQRKIGVEVSYSTAWRGKNKAVHDMRGTPEEGFKNLYSYLYMLESVNPGTKTSVLLDEAKRFKYLFVALGASIEGFQYMRKVITVDATFLKVVQDGVLIFATAQDPNHHHYPIAFGVVDGEKNESWTWFFTMLKTVIPDCPEMVFVSDRNVSLIKAVAEVYPKSQHGYCIFHLSNNVKLSVTQNRDEVAKQFREIAQIYAESEFLQQYADFRNRYPTCARYLDKSVEVEKWAKCYFPGARYNIDTSNCVESLNALFVKARKYPLLPMIDTIIAKMAEWFNGHRKDAVAGSESQKLVPFVENVLHDRCLEGVKLTVTVLNAFELEYGVIGTDGKTYLVDLRNKRCSCRYFDIDRYPCVHAIGAAIKCFKEGSHEMQDIYDLCSPYYLVEFWASAYSRTIYPVPHISEWIIPEHIKEMYALPPYFDKEKRKGRAQEKRFPSVGERRRKNKLVPNRNLEKWFRCSEGTQNL